MQGEREIPEIMELYIMIIKIKRSTVHATRRFQSVEVATAHSLDICYILIYIVDAKMFAISDYKESPNYVGFKIIISLPIYYSAMISKYIWWFWK